MIKQNLYGLKPRTSLDSAMFTKLKVALSFVFGATLLVSNFVPAQALADDIENLFREEQLQQSDPGSNSELSLPPASTPNPAASSGAGNGSTANGGTGDKAAPVDVKGVADLGKLEPFSDVAVIQKRYLPHTGRFEIFLGPTVVLNDAFFLNYGGNARFAYSFSERYSVEGVGTYLSINERQVTTDLREKRGVLTKSFVTPQTYMGLDLKWSPVYGKMTWMNRRITPFDLYFSLGLGMTGTNQNTSEPTLHLGTGQAFAKTKGIAWRWDFSWNMFTATSSVDPGAGSALYHNLMLTFGCGFFFPEASYR